MFYSIQLQCTISQDKILLTSTFYKIEINYQIFDRVLLYSSLNIVKLLVLAWSYPGQDPHQVYPLWIICKKTKKKYKVLHTFNVKF